MKRIVIVGSSDTAQTLALEFVLSGYPNVSMIVEEECPKSTLEHLSLHGILISANMHYDVQYFANMDSILLACDSAKVLSLIPNVVFNGQKKEIISFLPDVKIKKLRESFAGSVNPTIIRATYNEKYISSTEESDLLKMIGATIVVENENCLEHEHSPQN